MVICPVFGPCRDFTVKQRNAQPPLNPSRPPPPLSKGRCLILSGRQVNTTKPVKNLHTYFRKLGKKYLFTYNYSSDKRYNTVRSTVLF